MTTRGYARAFAAYEKVASTGGSARLVVQLLEGAMTRLREAEEAIAEGRIEDRYRRVEKAAAIVEALHQHLDFQHGGSVAQALDRLYTYLLLRMQEINVRNEPAVCREIVARLAEQRDAWAVLAEAPPAGPPPASAVSCLSASV